MTKINKTWLLIIKILLIISCPFFTLMLTDVYHTVFIINSCFLSFLIALVIFANRKLDNTINKKTIIYFIIACYFIKNVLPYNHLQEILDNENLPIDMITTITGIMALPITTYFVKWFCEHIFSKIVIFLKKLTNSERKFLYIILIISTIISLTVINNTVAFSHPKYDFDIIYTSDTGHLLESDAFINITNPENDIRQPLFAIFALPISLTAKAISSFCFFFRNGYEYETIMTIFQFVLLAISTILLSRLLKISEDKKKYFYLFVSCSFPYLLFSLLLEQYVISVFYLILAIYYYFKNPNKTNYLFVGAAGTLITSAIIFPLITKFKKSKNWLNNFLNGILAFIGTYVISGQLPLIYTFVSNTTELLTNFALGITFKDKLYQYTAFIRGLFFPNAGEFVWHKPRIPTYQLLSYNTIDIIGVIILILCIISFIINRKNKVALISFLWIIFSSIILLFIGWGTAENGLILYSLYFAWAFFTLIYMLIDKVFKNRKAYYLTIISLTAMMIFANISEFINIFNFAIKYHP